MTLTICPKWFDHNVVPKAPDIKLNKCCLESGGWWVPDARGRLGGLRSVDFRYERWWARQFIAGLLKVCVCMCLSGLIFSGLGWRKEVFFIGRCLPGTSSLNQV